MKYILLFFLFIFTITSNAQIKIEDVGDNWKLKVTEALRLIEKTDSEKYLTLIDVCNHISFWNGKFSTTEDSKTIMISQKDMNFNSINNIAAILVHESKHLFFLKHNCSLPPNDEEIVCYRYELNFLGKVPNVEPWLIQNAKNKIKYYESLD
jgi:hypothetical protein